jgi:RND family efflux transporter MFP subunit
MIMNLKYVYPFLAIALLSACGSKKEVKEDNSAVAYQTAPVQSKELEKGIRLPGELKAWQQVDIYAKVNSFVREVRVDRGSKVKKGEVLIVLNAPELESQLAEANAKYHAAQSTYTQKRTLYKAAYMEYKRLYETSKTPGTVSANDLENMQAKMQSDSIEMLSAQSDVVSAKSYYEAEQQMKDYLTVTAPFDGTITERNVHPGAFVGPAGKGMEVPMLKLDDEAKLRLVVAVPETYTGSMLDGQPVKFQVKAYPEETFTAKVNREAGSLNTTIRSEMIEMDVPNVNKKLKPGMYAEVKLDVERTAPSLVVPKSALVLSTERSFVIRVTNGHAEWVDVTKGNESNGLVEVFGPLKEGDKIVLNASDEIPDGKQLSVK